MNRGDSTVHPHQVRNIHFFLFFAATAVFLYLRTFLLPHTPLAAKDDELLFFEHAKRILLGQVPFRDFFIFVMPGTDLLYAGVFRAFGVHAWVAQGVLIALGLALTAVIVWISRNILNGLTVFLPALLFLVLDFNSALDATHHWYNILFVMAAAGVLLGGRSLRRILIAGSLCGIAALFTQTQGTLSLIAIAIYLVFADREEMREGRMSTQLTCLVVPFLVIVGGVLGYYAHLAGFHSLLYALWYYPFRFTAAEYTYPLRAYNYMIPPHHTLGDLARMVPFLFLRLLVPLVYLYCLLRLFFEKRKMDRRMWESLLLINLIGLALFAAIASGPSFHRTCMVAPPAVIVCVWLFHGVRPVDRAVRGALWLMSLGLFLYLPVRLQFAPRTYLDLPTGRTAFLNPAQSDEYRWFAQQTHAGDAFFNLTQVSFPLALRNPTPVDIVSPTLLTTPDQVDAVVRSLEARRTQFIFLPHFHVPPGTTDNLQAFHDYVYSHYHLAKTFPSGQFWELN
jgi:hypothetical protein